MNRHTGARWFNGLPRWIRNAVYHLTGWQVQRMTITRRSNVGTVVYATESTTYSWSRAKRIKDTTP